MNIILIGMRGSGKSIIGRLLAQKLDKNFIETDKLIEIQEGLLIRKIVKKFGWDKFREFESKIMQDLAENRTNDVIATGGGAVENEKNITAFKNNNDVVVLLSCSIETIIRRIGKDTERPLLTVSNNFSQDLRKIYKRRRNLYAKYADIIVSSEESANKATNNIIFILKERKLL